MDVIFLQISWKERCNRFSIQWK